MRTWIAIIVIAAYAAITPVFGQIDAQSAFGGVISPGSGKDPEISAQRAGIEAQRSQAQSRFEEGARQCYQKFVVNDCINNLRAQRREILADLRRQEIELNNQERRTLAAQRVQSVEDKTRIADEREALADPKQPAGKPELGSKPAAKAPKTFKEPKAVKASKSSKTSKKTKTPDAQAGATQAVGGAPASQSLGAVPSAGDRHQSAAQRAQRAADKQVRLVAAQEAAAKREKERRERGEKSVQGLPTPP